MGEKKNPNLLFQGRRDYSAFQGSERNWSVLRTDTLYISIIQRETDRVWSDKGGHHSSAVGVWQQHGEDEWTVQLSRARHTLLEKWYIYLPHNFFSVLIKSFTSLVQLSLRSLIHFWPHILQSGICIYMTLHPLSVTFFYAAEFISNDKTGIDLYKTACI